MTKTLRLELDVLLPEVEDERDACVTRLIESLESREGIIKAHVAGPGGSDVLGSSVHPPFEPGDRGQGAKLCLHYDPDQVSLHEVSTLATSAGAELSERYGHSTIQFRSVGTEDRGTALEEILRDVPGVLTASVNFAAQTARVEYDRKAAGLLTVLRALERSGAIPDSTSREDDERQPGLKPSWYRRHPELVWSLLSGTFLGLGWSLERFADPPAVMSIAIYLAAYAFGAQDIVRHAWGDLRRGKVHLGIDLLMVVAAAGAAFLGEWAEGGLLLFLFSLGHALEHYALGRARGAIKALGDLVPQTADVLRDGVEVRLPIEEVRLDDHAVIKPGERVSVDGEVIEGTSAVNQAPITGESVPIEKVAGSRVYAGSVNGDGALVVQVTAAVGDRTLDRVIKLVAEAETQKAPTQRFTERFERIFVPSVLGGVIFLMISLPLFGITDVETSVYRGLAALIAAAPCALALGTPAAVLAGIGQGARNGVLIKGGAHLESLGTVSALALDKTGTITHGKPVVTDLRPAEGVLEADLLRLTAAAERRSQHPLARAIMDEAEKRGIPIPPSDSLESVTGRGLRARVAGVTIEVGRDILFEEQGIPVPAEVAEADRELQASGRTTVLARESSSVGASRWLGVIGISDEPRPGVKEVFNALRSVGVRRIVMLTGDNEGVARAVSESVGIDEVFAGLLPEDKVRVIKELSSQDVVAMVGDGVNDAAALAHASVGIAMGGAGTAAALETADVALMADDLGKLPFAVGLSRGTRSVIRQNLVISLGVIGVLLVTSLFGITGIGWAVVVHEGSTLVVIANALRLLTFKGT